MIRRCTVPTHPDWEHYGGRGIKVCPEWLDFWTFVADVGEPPEGHEMDRIDNDGDYEPSNFRWATRTQQIRNRRHKEFCKYGHPREIIRGKWGCRECNRRNAMAYYTRKSQENRIA